MSRRWREGRSRKRLQPQGESTDAERRGGAARSGVEGPVMGWSEGAALFGLGHWPTGNGRMTVSGLLRRIGRLLATFSPQECRNFLRHAGYIQTCSESALITDSA